MQIKTISKTIKLKLESWLESITDEKLRKDVRDNVLVSGGSITSLLLGEPVNDYDLYLMDRDVLLRLAKYYVDGVDGAEVWDGKNKAEIDKKYKTDDVEEWKSKFASAYRNLQEDQIKIYISQDGNVLKVGNGTVLANVAEGTEVPKYRLAFLSPNAISLTDDIQIVVRFWGDASKVHSTFDFVHATNYFTFKNGVVTNIKALESILTKQLTYQGSQYPLTSVIRAKKFIKRNWNIHAGEYLKMMFQISLLDLTDMDILQEQLAGVDVAYFSTLITAIQKHKQSNKDFVLTPGYMNTLIDKIFNGAEDNEE